MAASAPEPPTRPQRPSPDGTWEPLIAVSLALADLVLPALAPLGLVAGIALFVGRRRAWGRRLAWAAAVVLAVAAAAQALLLLVGGSKGPDPEARQRGRRALVEGRLDSLVGDLTAAAKTAATLPEVQPALAGDRASLTRLFSRLEALREAGGEDPPALAIRPFAPSVLAWSGRIAESRSLLMDPARDAFVLAGSVTTTLVAAAPVSDPSGRLIGLATAERPLAVHRNIRNEYLSDFDRLADLAPGIEVEYVDVRDAGSGSPNAPGDAEWVAHSPRGVALARVRIANDDGSATQLRRERRAGAVRLIATACFFLFWLKQAHGLDRVLGATLVRALAALPSMPLIADATAGSGLQAAFLGQPWPAALTAAWALLVAWVLAEAAFRRLPRRSRAAGLAYAAIPALLVVSFAWLADTLSHAEIDPTLLADLPTSAARLLLQLTLFAVLASGVLGLTALWAWTGGGQADQVRRAALAASLVLIAWVALRAGPYASLAPPAAPAAAALAFAGLLAFGRERWEPGWRGLGIGGRACVLIAACAVLSLILHASLVHFEQDQLRARIQDQYAPLVLRQPQWREYVLAQARRRIDDLDLFAESSPGSLPLEELAFSVWSATDLASFGFSSAVEIQDPSGGMISRFALNLPSLGPSQPLPASDAWDTVRENLPAASGGGQVIEARRRLVHDGELRGAVRVYVKDDFWNLPFVRGRDPYSVLYRTASPAAGSEPPLALLVYDRRNALVFSSADQPPTLDAPVLDRARGSGAGLWVTLTIDDQPHDCFLFADAQRSYGLAYPRLGAGRFAADAIEAATRFSLLAIAAVFVMMVVRTALGLPALSLPTLWRSINARFSLRLFAAFIGIAVVPMLLLQVAMRNFVADRLRRETEQDAVERALVARQAVENFIQFRGAAESTARAPGLDAGLVYIGSLIRGDLDLFAQGRLMASSQRELYSSGLLSARVSGAAYRELILEGHSARLGTERIGRFSYLVVSVPVRIESPEPGILSLPLTLRQREADAVLRDLDRAVRLASVVLLVGAVLLAQSVARRISEPVQQLTAATRRVALGDLSARVEPRSQDELRDLVESFNRMAADLTAQRRDLERSNRLAAWAEMARQVAHEVKNPLTPIQLSAEHLRRVFGDRHVDFGATLASCTETILKQVRILRGIVTEFSAFARPPAAVAEMHDLGLLIRSALEPYQVGLPPGVRLDVELEPGARVRGDRRLLERAVVNLVENALQAVGETGAIDVRLRAVDGRAEVLVEDDGPGLDPELRDRIFEPFFSTKSGGSGLGLALVRKIAEDHGGGIDLERVGSVTRARLWLPRGGATLS